MHKLAIFLLILKGFSQYPQSSHLQKPHKGSCLSNQTSAQLLIFSSDLSISSQQFTMVFWVMIQDTINNYGYVRSFFQLSPTPSQSSHSLFLGYTPSTLQITSCTSSVSCSEAFLQVDSRRLMGFWTQITVSIDTQNHLRIFAKAIYTNLQNLQSTQNILIDLNQISLSFQDANLYDYIPFNQFNVKPMCGQIKQLTIIDGLFTNDNTANLDLILNYLVYLPLLSLPSTQVIDLMNKQLIFNIHGEQGSNKKGFKLRSKAYMIQQPPLFGKSFTVTFWMKANSMSLLSPTMPIIQYILNNIKNFRRQTSKNSTIFLIQAENDELGYNLLISFSGQIAQIHGQFNLQNAQFYRVVLACYYNQNLLAYVFSLFVTNSIKPYQSLFVNSNGLLYQRTTDLLVIGDRLGVKPWATGNTITVFDLRIFDGFSLNFPGGQTTENCYVSIGSYPRYCLACSSQINKDSNSDPYLNCNEGSAYSVTSIIYCPEGFIWSTDQCLKIQILNCARAYDIINCQKCKYGYVLVNNSCTQDLPNYLFASTKLQINAAFYAKPNSSWQIFVDSNISKNILTFIQSNKTLGYIEIRGNSSVQFTVRFNDNSINSSQNNLYLYFYPLGTLKRINLNQIGTQSPLTVSPNISVIPLQTAVNITYGITSKVSPLLLYNLYLYTNQKLIDLDMAVDQYDHGTQLLYLVESGSLQMYIPMGESYFFVCITLNNTKFQSLVQQEIILTRQTNLSISRARVHFEIYIFQNSTMRFWKQYNSTTLNKKLLIMISIVLSLEHIDSLDYCTLGCSGNGHCDKNKICICNLGFNFYDCSGTVDDAITYNIFLVTLLQNLSSINTMYNKNNLAQFLQIQTLTSFLLKNTDLTSVYYSIDMNKITSFVSSLINKSLTILEQTQIKNSSIQIDMGIAVASEIFQQTNTFSLYKITDIFAQLLKYTDTLKLQFSNEQIDNNPSRLYNITIINSVNISIIKAQTYLAINYIQRILLASEDILSLDQVIITSGISFYRATTNGSQLHNLFQSFLNITGLLHSPNQFYNSLGIKIDQNQQLTNSFAFDLHREYIFLISILSQNPDSFKNNFYYASASFPYISIKGYEKINQYLTSQQQNTLISIWFSTSQEFANTRWVGPQNGNFICVQQDINQHWSQNSCQTLYVSVLYVICECYLIGPITLIDDYKYKILPLPKQPPTLQPISFIIYFWAPIAGIWLMSTMWGNLTDQEESAENVSKRLLDTERLRRASIKRVSIGLGQGTNKIVPSESVTDQISQKRKTLIEELSTKNMIGPEGNILVEAFSVDQLIQIQEQFGQAKFTNISLMPSSNLKAFYTPDTIEENQAVKPKQNETFLFIMNILNTHTLIGALSKYKITLPRAYRLALIFQRINIIFIFTGYFVTLGLPSLFILCFCVQLIAIFYRTLEQYSRELMKNSLQDQNYGNLYRLINFIVQICFIGLQIYIISLQLSDDSMIYVQDWAMTFGYTFLFDQIVIESFILCGRIIYRKYTKNIKLTQKFKSNQINGLLVMPPNNVQTQIDDQQNSEQDKSDSQINQ